MVEGIILVIVVIVVVLVFLSFVPLGLWISALASGVHVSIFTLAGMRIRRVSPAKIVNPLIKAEKAGLNMEISKMEAHFLAGGNLDRVITALITARGANIKLDFPEACAIDLAGRDVLQAVQMSVNPKVIETPVVAAIAKDGIELRAKARVTVRANIERLVGGAGEETVVARVGEGIVTTVGIRPCWKTRISSAARCWARALIPARPLRSFPLILRMWMWAATSAHSCRWIRQRPTAGLPRQRRRRGVPWQWPVSRR